MVDEMLNRLLCKVFGHEEWVYDETLQRKHYYECSRCGRQSEANTRWGPTVPMMYRNMEKEYEGLERER